MHAQGIVKTSGSAVRELQLILNWMQVCHSSPEHRLWCCAMYRQGSVLDSCSGPSCFLIVATGPGQSVTDLYWVVSCRFNLNPSILLANHITLFSTFCSTIIKLHT